jgi:hypothetical protein
MRLTHRILLEAPGVEHAVGAEDVWSVELLRRAGGVMLDVLPQRVNVDDLCIRYRLLDDGPQLGMAFESAAHGPDESQLHAGVFQLVVRVGVFTLGPCRNHCHVDPGACLSWRESRDDGGDTAVRASSPGMKWATRNFAASINRSLAQAIRNAHPRPRPRTAAPSRYDPGTRMNRLISTNLDSVFPDKLPPRQRGAQARILFISSVGLGFRRYYEQMIHYAGLDPDIDAVHIEVRQPLAVKLFCATVPVLGRRGWDQKSLRYHLAWWPILRSWFRGSLDLEHFDVVHMTHGISLGFVGAPQAQAKFALNVDVTAVQDYRELGYARTGRLPMVAAERRMYEAADLVVCRNRWACGSVVNDFGISQQRTHVALSSLPLPAKSRADLPPHEGLLRIAFVGHQFERKAGPSCCGFISSVSRIARSCTSSAAARLRIIQRAT